MANKNTKNLRKLIRKTSKNGGAAVTIQTPAGDYHSNGGYVSVTFPTATPNKEGVISGNKNRNTQMRVLHNSDGNCKQSLTVHEPMDKRFPVRFKNHAYIRKTERDENLYRQLPNVRE